MIVALVAGEPSGDALGADLIADLSKIYPNATFVGIAGPRMQAVGCKSLFPMETLSVMGIAEVLPKLPAILSVRRKLINYFNDNPPDVFIGIDAPDFNLPVEKSLKKRGIKTVHYVSPTVWAWREKRILSIKKSTDLMLCLFPFEPAVYEKYGMKASFIGHPAVERLRLSTAHNPIPKANEVAPRRSFNGEGYLREQLGYQPDEIVVAILPGSRSMEIKHLAPIFFAVAETIRLKYPRIKFILPAVNERIKNEIAAILEKMPLTFHLQLIVGSSDLVMDAADIVLCTSGTTTLEAMILNKPMVVAYKMSAFNWWLAQHLVNVKYVALPNLLADKPIVPEFVQADANIYNLTQAVEKWIIMPNKAEHCKALYEPYNRQLAQNASQQAAEAIAEMISQNG